MHIDTDKKQILTVSNIRNVNIMNILNSIIRDRQKIRSELANENQISVMTVKHIVDDLIDAGIIVEKVSMGAEVGRKPKALEISENYGNIVCINMTSNKEISFIIYDIYENRIENKTEKFNEKYNYRENLKKTVDHIKKCLEKINTITIGIAVFVPSAYYEEVDLVNYDLIPELKELHIKAMMKEEFGIKNVLVLHDVFPAAMSEYSGRNPSIESQFYFYCGYGVGGFFIYKDVPIMGHELMAGEVGKMVIPLKNSDKEWDTFENIVSIPAILSQMRKNNILDEFDIILEKYKEGEEPILKIMNHLMDVAARALYNLLWVYNPSCFVIDSCYPGYRDIMIERFEKFLSEMQNDAIPIKVEITPARYDEYHMMRGCFHMVRTAWIEERAAFRNESEK